MEHTHRFLPFLIVVLLAGTFGCTPSRETAVVTTRPEPPAAAEPADVAIETPGQVVTEVPVDVRPGRFDTGKMWTFDNPPIDYFEEAYGFRPDSAWFQRARLGALRIPGCSASFVSSGGLMLTNHHCGRSHITAVTRPGESLLDDGFYAETLEEERRVEDLYADQLIEIDDVTAEVYAAARDAGDPAAAREQQVERLEARLTAEAKQRDTTMTVEVIELYDGGQYAAYTFRRYHDVRLVMAPEVLLGSFGGDPDNFTYPRYSLDFSLFRVYDEEGTPLEPAYHFPWSLTGATEGDVVFVVGNPGTTSRLNTVAQLAFERDYSLPREIDVLRSRAEILREYVRTHEQRADSVDLRNTLHQIENELKRTRGQLEGLRNDALIARRAAAEAELIAAIQASDSLQEVYGGVVGRIADLQQAKEAMAGQAGAFTYFAAPIVDAHVLVRSIYGYIYSLMKQRGATPGQLEDIRKEALAIEDWPAEVEEAMLAARLHELRSELGPTDPTINRILSGRTPEAVAEEIIANTALLDSARYAQVLEEGYLGSGDPTVPLAEALTPLYFSLQNQLGGITSQEEELNAQLALARFAVYGTDIPPDASFSLRIADGVVRGYPYNGTMAAPFTTYFGLYNHYYSYGGEGTEWDLPERWLTPPPTFDRSTPVNLVSTNDITGGNSGSPLLNRDLELVGLIFDSNMEALPNTYLYTDERARAISVDARGILESLDDLYDADRLVLELTTGRLVPTEAEADEMQAD